MKKSMFANTPDTAAPVASDLNEYQRQARTTAVYDFNLTVLYPMIGMVNEAGEALGKLKKVLRRDKTLQEAKADLADELGDVLWYLAVAADDLGYNLKEIAENNLKKLADRQQRGVLKGDGDSR